MESGQQVNYEGSHPSEQSIAMVDEASSEYRYYCVPIRTGPLLSTTVSPFPPPWPDNRLGAVCHLEFGEDVGDVVADSFGAEGEALGEVLRQTPGETRLLLMEGEPSLACACLKSRSNIRIASNDGRSWRGLRPEQFEALL